MSWLKYLVPYRHLGGSSATVFGVDVFGSDLSDRHPIWWVYRLGKRIDKIVWGFKWRYVRRHQYNIVRTDLKPGYYDEDTRMLHACMTLLCHYVEWHGGPDKLDRFTQELRTEPDPHAPEGIHDHQVNTQSEAVAIYRWWKYERPANHERHDEMLHRLYSGRRMVTRPVQIGNETLHEYVGLDGPSLELPGDSNEALWALDRQNDEDDQRMLHRLIDIRPGLWT
jgi:hypothetical protein